MIHVCYSLRDRSGKYSKFVGTSMQSLLDNTESDVTIHIIHDSTIGADNKLKFRQIVKTHGQSIQFYNAENFAAEKLPLIDSAVQNFHKNREKLSAFYRLMIPNLLSNDISKVIYLDSDTIVNLDITELWNQDLNWFPLAAVTQAACGHTEQTQTNANPFVRSGIFKWNDYFNSGVLVIDLNQLRESEIGTNLLEHCLQIRKDLGVEARLLDQDALNFIFKKNFLKLPAKFNRLVFLARRLGNPKTAGREIIHYAGQTLETKFDDDFNKIWFKYFCRTPFCTPETLLDLVESVQYSIMQTNSLWNRVVNLSTTRFRGFFVYPKDAGKIVELIGKNDADIGLNASFPNAIDNLISVMEENRDNIIFFINISDTVYPNLREKLICRGFKEYTDFINVKDLAPVKDSSQLIQKM